MVREVAVISWLGTGPGAIHGTEIYGAGPRILIDLIREASPMNKRILTLASKRFAQAPSIVIEKKGDVKALLPPEYESLWQLVQRFRHELHIYATALPGPFTSLPEYLGVRDAVLTELCEHGGRVQGTSFFSAQWQREKDHMLRDITHYRAGAARRRAEAINLFFPLQETDRLELYRGARRLDVDTAAQALESAELRY